MSTILEDDLNNAIMASQKDELCVRVLCWFWVALLVLGIVWEVYKGFFAS